MKMILKLAFLILTVALVAGGCTSRRELAGSYLRRAAIKDNKPMLWVSDDPRVVKFKNRYLKTRTVERALRRGRRYLRRIALEFEARNLPPELAYLPILESLFKNRANSGHARGMWQFTRQTAREMGLKVGFMVDERMDWRKATAAAADYLDELGRAFNYNWALALAAYNGGPNYMRKEMRRQHSWDFWELDLRRETAEYVPRFIAMLQVAREKYPHLMVAGS